jgi:hypothetical protein
MKPYRILLYAVVALLVTMSHIYAGDNIPTLIYPISGSALIPKGDFSGSQSPIKEYAIVDMNQLKSLKTGDKVQVVIGNSSVIMKTKSIKQRTDGTTWLGIPENYSSWDYILLTTSGDYAFGTLQAGSRTIKITPSYATGIVEIKELNPALEKPMGDDIKIPPPPPSESSSSNKKDLQNVLSKIPVVKAEDSSNYTTVDVMVYYTPGVVAYYGSEEAAKAAIQHFVDLTNQAFANSQVSLQIRIVAQQQIPYSDDGSPCQALDDLTDAKGIFSDMPSLRSRYGADLVVLLRRFNNSTNDACGCGWVLSSMTQKDWAANHAAFSVVQVGNSADGSAYYCSDFTFSHELGHNFGCAHDRAHASGSGIFPYSYGFINPAGTWGTIMAYHSSRIPFFSNPNVTYRGEPTGIAPNNPNAADNALTINQTKDFVASYMSSGGGGTSFETDGILINISTRGYVGTGDNVMIAGFCVYSRPLSIIIRALGPSLASYGVYGTLRDPMFEIRSPSGTLLYQNDDWIYDSSAPVLTSLGIQPSNSKEAAAAVTAYPGCFTVIVKGVGGSTGVALVEVYDIKLFLH